METALQKAERIISAVVLGLVLVLFGLLICGGAYGVVRQWSSISLAFAACGVLWLSQAVTGLAMVYRWELDDAAIRAPVVRLDPEALGNAIAALERGTPARKITSLWATGGVEGRYDLYVDAADGSSQVLRVDGAGRLLRTRPDEGGGTSAPRSMADISSSSSALASSTVRAALVGR